MNKEGIGRKRTMSIPIDVLNDVIGRRAEMVQGPNREFTVPVVIEDARMSYGALQYLVRPLAGSGKGWIDQQRITLGNRHGIDSQQAETAARRTA